jgi:hypothetical protein
MSLSIFLELSESITGFDQVRLLGTGLAELNLGVMTEVVGEEIASALLQHFANLPDRSARTLRRALFDDAKFGPITRSLLKLWYSGVWYRLPADWHHAFGPRPNDGTFVPSPQSYVEGLLWPAVGAHPAGAKAPGYGSWQYPPQIPSP